MHANHCDVTGTHYIKQKTIQCFFYQMSASDTALPDMPIIIKYTVGQKFGILRLISLSLKNK